MHFVPLHDCHYIASASENDLVHVIRKSVPPRIWSVAMPTVAELKMLSARLVLDV